MKADALYREGKLAAAIDAQIAEVRGNATDPNRRLFLFELLTFQGDLDRAQKQLDMLDFKEPELKAAQTSYVQCLAAERKRRAVLEGKADPRFLTEVGPGLKLRLEAVKLLAQGKDVEAGEKLAQAQVESPTVKATVNGTAVDEVRDADDLFSHVLEVFSKGEYFWVPLELVERLSTVPPKTPRDLLWLPGHLEVQGASGDVFLPGLYAFSHNHPDDALKLGRAADWLERDGGVVCGVGVKTWIVGEEAISLWDVRDFLDEATGIEPLDAEPAADAPSETPPADG